MKYFNKDEYWEIYTKQFAIWQRLEGSANGDYGCIGINMICMHRHLKISWRTSPYSIIKELREYFAKKIGINIFLKINIKISTICISLLIKKGFKRKFLKPFFS